MFVEKKTSPERRSKLPRRRSKSAYIAGTVILASAASLSASCAHGMPNGEQSYLIYANTGNAVIGLGCYANDRIGTPEGITESSERQLLYGSLRNPANCIIRLTPDDIKSSGWHIPDFKVGMIFTEYNGLTLERETLSPLSDEKNYKQGTNVSESNPFKASSTISRLETIYEQHPKDPVAIVKALNELIALNAPTDVRKLLSLTYVCSKEIDLSGDDWQGTSAVKLGDRYTTNIGNIGESIAAYPGNDIKQHWGAVTEPSEISVVPPDDCILITSYAI